MIDFNKPIQTRSGLKAELMALSASPGLCEELAIPFHDGQTVLVRVFLEGGESYTGAYYPDGRYYSDRFGCEDDLVNAPETFTVYRTFSLRDDTRTLGVCVCSTLDGALHLAKRGPSIWDGVLELISEGGRLIDVKFHKVEEDPDQ